MSKIENFISTPDVFPPVIVDSADAVNWDDSADVVVVGFGAAGASAALELHDQAPHTDVMIVDRFEGGGATALSGGIFYAGATKFLQQAGYDDSAEEMYKYLKIEAGDAVSDDTLRRFCETSSGTVEWLEKHGVCFNSAVFEGKAVYPPEDKFLYYSGNEKLYKDQAKPAPRGHRTFAKGFSGYRFFEALKNSVEKCGIRQIHHAPVRRMVMDKSGAVVGLEVGIVSQKEKKRHLRMYTRWFPLLPFLNLRAEKAIANCQILETNIRERRLIRARKGVVLATGGFIFNAPMLKQYVHPNLSDNYLVMSRMGSMGCSGAGIRLGLSIGAAVSKIEKILAGRSIAPPEALVEGVLVNCEGKRFINEDAYQGSLGQAMSLQRDGKAWMILDGSIFRKVLRETLPGDGKILVLKLVALANILFGGTKRARTVEELAAKCGIDPAGLAAEISGYNQAAMSGSRDLLGKNAEYFHALGEGPYRAINLFLSNPFATTLAITLGGLKVNEATGAVKRPDGTEIKGLYAAGRVAAGVCVNDYFASGISLSDCVFSGRRAGHHLAGN